MGLDMYINKNKTVKNNMRTREVGEKFKRTVEITEVLYLRKANQIHRYIVNNFGGGRDECQEICIDIDDIRTLNDICKRIVKECKLTDDWVYYERMGYKHLKAGDEVELAEKDGLKFVPKGKCSASMLDEGDYIYDNNERHANKVEAIDKEGDEITIRYGQEGVVKVITNPELAQELLPTQAGFFFGDTSYTEYYIEDLKEYIRQADEIIADYENEIANGTDKYDLDYTYQASW